MQYPKGNTLKATRKMENINCKKIILASKSPRRKQLMEQLGMTISICPSNIDESLVALKEPAQYVKELAMLKARDVAMLNPGFLVIGADTIVVSDGEILGKPGSKTLAIEMLNKLNNREHFVYTGFCIYKANLGSIVVKSVKTKVYFKNLSTREINFYANTNEPYDKAGGYGIQGIGSFIVRKISGSYTNVVGLPVCELVEELNKINKWRINDILQK